MVDDPRLIDIWRVTYFFAMVLGIAFLGLRFRKRLGLPVVVIWGYFLCSALMTFENPFSYSWGIPFQLDQSSGQAFAQLLMVPLMVLAIPRAWFHRWKVALVTVALLDVLAVFIWGKGVMIATSFDAAFMALLVPMANVLAIFPLMVGIIYAKGSTAFLVLIAEAAGAILIIKKIRHIAPILAAVSMALLLAVYTQGHELLEPTGRLNSWRRYMAWWDTCANHVFGTGTGTFMWISPYTKIFGDNAFLHMHNDWLQVLFEGGTIGLSLLLAFAGHLLWKSRHRPYHFTTVCGLMACMLTYHPLHFFFTSFLACCLARDILYAPTKRIPDFW